MEKTFANDSLGSAPLPSVQFAPRWHWTRALFQEERLQQELAQRLFVEHRFVDPELMPAEPEQKRRKRMSITLGLWLVVAYGAPRGQRDHISQYIHNHT